MKPRKYSTGSSTFIEDKESKLRHLNETMAQCVSQDSMGRYNHSYVLERDVPNTLICPAIDVIQTSQDFGLHRGYLARGDLMLLEAQGYCRGKEPDQLNLMSQIQL